MRAVHWTATGAASLMIVGGLLSTPATAAPMPFTGDLRVGITGPATPTAGTPVDYSVEVRRVGGVAGDTTVTTTLSPAFKFQSVQNDAGWTCSGPTVGYSGSITCTEAAFAPGTATFTFRVVPASVGETAIGTAVASVPAAADDDASNDTASVAVNVQAPTTPTPPAGDKWGDPGYPPGWFGGYGYGGYGYGDYDDYYDDCDYYCY